MSARIFSASIHGIDAGLIEVEVDSTAGLPAFQIVGLGDKSISESKDRIASAIRNSGLTPASSKRKRIVVNLAPAEIKKEGAAYDLPIALGYLFESGQVKFDTQGRLFAGQLSLDGSLRHINGVLAMSIFAKNNGFRELILPEMNAREAAIINGIDVIPAKTLLDVIAHLDGTGRITPMQIEASALLQDVQTKTDYSLLYIKGQESTKRSLAVAAAGGHNLFMCGVPGSGKTILARALQEFLPELSLSEAIEVEKIYSSLGLLRGNPLSFRRPFRAPHHTTSPVAVIGGGTIPRPGEISLAHRGVLFLDELPEFQRNVLEALRQPLEDGTVTVARASGSVTLPAKFMLVAAMNPCPCGNYGDSNTICTCAPNHVLKYRKRVSGPMLDRMDIQINVPRETILSASPTMKIEEITAIKKKIESARHIQENRFIKYGFFTNAEISYKNIDALCILSSNAEKLLQHAVDAKRLSMRAYHKIKKISRTIADLEQSEHIQEHHIAEAISLRINDTLFSEL